MPGFVHQLHYATSANLTATEAAMLIVLGLLAVLTRKKFGWAPVVYATFLILYITLFRRAPGYKESILLPLRLYPSLGIWVGNLLNLILYIPFGWAVQGWRGKTQWVILSGLCLSVFCEAMQYLTVRGQADLNDVLFNTLGAAFSVWLSRWFAQ